MKHFQNILAIDTASAGVSVAVVAGEQSFSKCEAMVRGQAEYLVPFVDDALGESGVAYADLDAVLCTVGPGAFTGLRIGLSAARAFGLSLDIPVFGVSSLQACALQYCDNASEAFIVILETKRSDFYVQRFDEHGAALSEALALSGDEMVDLIVDDDVLIGDGVARFTAQNKGNFDYKVDYELIDMSVAARVLQARGEGGIFVKDAAPIYLRGADVSLPKKAARKLEVGS